MINVTAIDHVVFRAKDVDLMVSFYTKMISARLEKQNDEIGLGSCASGRRVSPSFPWTAYWVRGAETRPGRKTIMSIVSVCASAHGTRS